ncbi:ISH11-type transposase ISHwa14 [Halococcus thailandensis JCM 13552]|uniref:ISH11-type transposase ISHwa14 n=1 Tax=Halococcus thailandensis JCM 13552 TaxID=1227457 RepID=M0NGK3_9EURY|nr:ISH11-type transposase ISHwa14 [Halococcus thailandensis JCM 13552]
MRVTSDALAVKKPIWTLGDAEFDMLDWHDRLLEQGVVPVVPYNQRNATDPLDIEYRVEDTIAVTEERLDEAYRKRSRIETAIGVCKDLGLGTPRVRGRGSRLHSQITNGIMTSLVQPSPYENHSAPPPIGMLGILFAHAGSRTSIGHRVDNWFSRIGVGGRIIAISVAALTTLGTIWTFTPPIVPLASFVVGNTIILTAVPALRLLSRFNSRNQQYPA